MLVVLFNCKFFYATLKLQHLVIYMKRVKLRCTLGSPIKFNHVISKDSQQCGQYNNVVKFNWGT